MRTKYKLPFFNPLCISLFLIWMRRSSFVSFQFVSLLRFVCVLFNKITSASLVTKKQKKKKRAQRKYFWQSCKMLEMAKRLTQITKELQRMHRTAFCTASSNLNIVELNCRFGALRTRLTTFIHCSSMATKTITTTTPFPGSAFQVNLKADCRLGVRGST